jgi:ribosomal protein S18 acetylase RimI-like enzyme
MAFVLQPVDGYDQLERWVAVRNAVGPDTASVERAALMRAADRDHVSLLAVDGAEDVGAGFLRGSELAPGTGQVLVEIRVPVEHRRRGIGSALLDALTKEARERGYERVVCEVLADDEGALAFLDRRDYRLAWQTSEVRRLLLPGPAVEPPAGVAIAWLTDDVGAIPGMYEVARVTYPELPWPWPTYAGSEREWRTYELDSPDTRLELTAVARAGGEVVGYSLLQELTDENALFHRMTVVAPAWRRRGVGRALIEAQAAAGHDDGAGELVAVPLTEAHHGLYRAAGYEATQTWLVYESPPLR